MRLTGARKKIRIGDLLVEAGAITDEQLQEALAKQKEEGGMLVSKKPLVYYVKKI